MKPLYLEMTAFGSYAEKTVLPFEELRHGLYLVTGETGAGKTTIFDAIVFALYGLASGSDRKGDMLHCDHVPKSTDTVVKLRFDQSGREYTVTRTLHFSKKRGGGEQYGDGQLNAQLEEPERAPTVGSTKVTERCEELLGLNAEQFRKIIMLAQGEFKEFLKADSDKKNEILGKLFDNSSYLYYQNLLIGARDELRQRRTGQEERLRTLMLTAFQTPPQLSAEERERYLPGHPELAENLAELAETESRRLEQLRESRDLVDRRIEDLIQRKGAAATVNKLILDMESERAKLAALEAQTPAMEARESALARAELAYRRVRPAMERQERAYDKMNRTQAESERLAEELDRLEQELEIARKQADEDAETDRELQTLQSGIDALNRELPRYRDLRQKREEKAAAARAAADTRAELERQQELLDAAAEGLRTLRERLDAGTALEGAVPLREAEAQAARQTLEGLDGAKGLRTVLGAIRRQERKLTEEREQLLRLTGEAAEAAAAHASLYQQFLAGQAGWLARDLRVTLEARGEGCCPVCGSRLCRGQEHQLAPLPENTPDEDAVKAAEQRARRLERSRADQQSAAEALAASLTAQKQAALEQAAGPLPDCRSWEQLSGEGYLDAAVSRAALRLEEAEAALSRAREQLRQREQDKKRLPELEAELQRLRESCEHLKELEGEKRHQAQQAEAAIAELLRSLSQQDETSALAEKTKMEARFGMLDRQIREHRNRRDEAQRRRDTCQGSLEAVRTALEQAAAEQATALAELDRCLAETGFASPAEAELALVPLTGQNADEWLARERAALSEYAFGKKQAAEQLQRLRGQTADRQLTDLTELESSLLELNERYGALNEEAAGQEALLKNHREILRQVRELRQTLSESDGAWRRLENLAALAGGVSSEGGKLSFDRYVMGAVFREILEMANRRMELMSGGRYVLVHKAGADRRNAKAGLEIEVLDNNTGLQRPSGSLSGGESFFTSLALALGLSDVVQNHAGGKRMDALFIDEGFGTLSDDVLDKALDVLNQLTEGNRLVGIISHVDKLDESIPQKIRVRSGERGSSLTLELA